MPERGDEREDEQSDRERVGRVTAELVVESSSRQRGAAPRGRAGGAVRCAPASTAGRGA